MLELLQELEWDVPSFVPLFVPFLLVPLPSGFPLFDEKLLFGIYGFELLPHEY